MRNLTLFVSESRTKSMPWPASGSQKGTFHSQPSSDTCCVPSTISSVLSMLSLYPPLLNLLQNTKIQFSQLAYFQQYPPLNQH
jgi:hypothetical protein